ncbi:LmbE family N-acetylglucosaminyl deacetylase [Actinomycetospora succinea]|uniref:LmbE family N-acetylglucosaminyl deacetylase n=1 Tax=Actinomycetospora succinea TaxID=663603 RepID=A0A4R6V6M5_9PSEU|nr:PIG-L deacetylase family protein [Actinomycetospora succinea]TDQ54117.1 LmbE family N-acetylglucosaminyl deacetylase [Actinomycetospora succinea]
MSTDLPALPDDFARVLAVAAHPDDLEYGAAAAVAAWTSSGREVSYVLVTRGEAGIADLPPEKAGPLREDEERRSAAVVGVHDVRFLEHRDGVVVEGIDLRRDLAREIRRARPELVVVNSHHETFGPGAWNSADHRAVGRATIDAAGDAANRWIFPELVDEGFEPWQVRYVAVASSTQPTHTLDVTGHQEAAIASLAEHQAYLTALDPRPVAEQAREVVLATTGGDDGRARVDFEVF